MQQNKWNISKDMKTMYNLPSRITVAHAMLYEMVVLKKHEWNIYTLQRIVSLNIYMYNNITRYGPRKVFDIKFAVIIANTM